MKTLGEAGCAQRSSRSSLGALFLIDEAAEAGSILTSLPWQNGAFAPIGLQNTGVGSHPSKAWVRSSKAMLYLCQIHVVPTRASHSTYWPTSRSWKSPHNQGTKAGVLPIVRLRRGWGPNAYLGTEEPKMITVQHPGSQPDGSRSIHKWGRRSALLLLSTLSAAATIYAETLCLWS